jgi:GntR family transcriptional regulator
VLGISEGKLKPGEQLPTVRGLAEEIGINSMTVNKAYQLLKQEGYIYTDRRNGAKVREHLEFSGELPRAALENLQKVISEAKIRGISREEFAKLCDEYYN